MMQISVSHDLHRTQSWAGRMKEQLPFANALALTRTGQDVGDALSKALPQHLEDPTPFTMKAFGVQRATKQSQRAVVFTKQAQEQYLKWQIFGGSRPPARKAQKLPSNIKLNQYGNIPRGEVQRLVALAREGKKVSKARGRKLGISNKVDLFYGDPNNGMPPGLYKRVGSGDDGVLVPLVVFPAQNVQYEKRFPMFEIGQRVVGQVYAGHWRTAFEQAMASAK